MGNFSQFVVVFLLRISFFFSICGLLVTLQSLMKEFQVIACLGNTPPNHQQANKHQQHHHLNYSSNNKPKIQTKHDKNSEQQSISNLRLLFLLWSMTQVQWSLFHCFSSLFCVQFSCDEDWQKCIIIVFQVRKEFIIALWNLMQTYEDDFKLLIRQLHRQEQLRLSLESKHKEQDKKKKSKAPSPQSPTY